MRQHSLCCLATIIAVTVASVSLASENAASVKPIRIVLVGDSTVASYAKPPADKPDLTGWGQVFGDFFNDRVTVLNHAKSGRSTKSFIKEGLWKKALADKGDYIFIQFGHNDSHLKDGKPAVDAATDFQSYLRQYVDEARAAGSKPVLVTPVARRTFKDGKIVTGLQPYPDAMFKVGKEKGVPVIDLHAAAMRLFDRLGDAGSADMTASANDRTHFSHKGAEAMARLVVEALPQAVPELTPCLKAPRTWNKTAPESALESSKDCYLFSYFVGNGEDGLHLARSNDGYHWQALNGGKSFLAPQAGKSRLMRDPCLFRASDGTFHLVWTNGWKDRTIG
jgi:lysophospholipase L1-like esterase